MKTTQDNHILLNAIAAQLGYALTSLTQYSDKSFQIDGYKEDSNEVIFNSDEDSNNFDINDFGYLTCDEACMHILAFLENKKNPPIVNKPSIADQARARLTKQPTNTDKYTEL